MDKDEDEAEEHFEWLVEHAPEWEPQEPTRSKPKSINQLKSEDDILINMTSWSDGSKNQK